MKVKPSIVLSLVVAAGAVATKLTFAPWGSTDNSKPPRNATAEGAKELKVKINGKPQVVKENKSKQNTTYFYAEIDGTWYWSRGPVTDGASYVDYVKPEPAPKAPKAPKEPKAPKADTKSTTPAKSDAKATGTKTTTPAKAKAQPDTGAA